MWLYLAGPLTALPDGETGMFEQAARELRDAGFVVVNPHALGYPPTPPATNWNQAMRIWLRGLLECDGVVSLPGWGWTTLADMELQIANQFRMRVLTIPEWLATTTGTTGGQWDGS